MVIFLLLCAGNSTEEVVWVRACHPGLFTKKKPKEHWPPNNPDANPLGAFVWGRVELRVNKSRHPNLGVSESPCHVRDDHFVNEGRRPASTSSHVSRPLLMFGEGIR